MDAGQSPSSGARLKASRWGEPVQKHTVRSWRIRTSKWVTTASVESVAA